MIIHVVQPGETIYSIASQYNVSPQKIVRDNQLENPNSLVPGQTLVILQPDIVYTVKAGDTLESIARQFGTTTVKLLQNNPYIMDSYQIVPGDAITITNKGEKRGTIFTNGYVYPFVNREELLKTLPYLTYLSIFTYGITPEGNLIGIEDEEIIRLARDYGVAPLMVIATLNEEGVFSNELAKQVLNDPVALNNLIENIVSKVKEKQYAGIDIDFEFILPEDKEAFINFVQKVTQRLNEEGFQTFIALAPKTYANQPGLLYAAHDYPALGSAANRVLLMTYEWGYTYGPPMAVAPINNVKQVLDYAVTAIDPNKIYMGIPNYGYDFTLPYVQGESKAETLSVVEAVGRAKSVGAKIQFDETAQTPFFTYYDKEGRQHEVWFEDARSIKAKLDQYEEYNLEGVGYWQLMNYFPQNWLVVNSLYDIAKIL